MINTDILTEKATDYLNRCQEKHKRPTYKGMGKALNISGRTISNVVHGEYNHTPYGIKEHHNRCIANKDFELIREVFEYTVISKQ